MAIVYLATNRVNGKRYVGVTAKSLVMRRYGHHYDARKGRKKTFSRAIRKYGEAAFEWIILHDYLFPEDAVQAEVRFVEALKPEYNMTNGGDGVRGLKMSDESKAKMSVAHTPARRAKASAVMTENWKRDPNMSKRSGLSRKGKPNLKARGKKRSQQQREYLRQIGRQNRDQFIERMRAIPKGNERIVICMDDGLEFPSASAAARHYAVAKSSIIEHCLGKGGRLTVCGKHFQYKDAPIVQRANKKCKLDANKVRAIRKLLGSLSHRNIAKQFKVSRVAVTDLSAGRTWRHV